MGGLWPYPQTLDYTGKACTGQTLYFSWPGAYPRVVHLKGASLG